VSSITSLAMALSIRSRQTKNHVTRACSNMMTILSWAFAIIIIYGRCGVAGVGADFEVQTIVGLPTSLVGTLLLAPLLLLLEGESNFARKTSKYIGPSGHKSERLIFSFPHLHRSNRWAPLFFASVSVLLTASLYSILLRGAWFLSVFDEGMARNNNELLNALFREETHGKAQDLAALAGENILLSNAALASSARLAGSSIWTATNFSRPILNLIGLLATLPSLRLLFIRAMKTQSTPLPQVTLALSFTIIPIVACQIPGLQVTGVMALFGGLYQVVGQRQADKESRMRI
jgi:hypothetical protein